ncbi:MAG: class I SAM-dependent methyltransferase [Patescibacteria group bacterium]
MSTEITHKSTCRICKGKNLSRILSFGPTPPANAFLRTDELSRSEPYYPLDVNLCGVCGLVQLADVVDSRILFKDYVYVSSTSPVFIAHFGAFAKEVFTRFNLSKKSLVVDIGSNDGILLRPFKKLGARVLGVEPDTSIANLARKAGIPTVSEFFTPNTTKKILQKYGSADVITATNVFAHIDDIHAVAKGVKMLLTKEGVFIIEAPYLVDFLDKNLFDTVYHEHLSYLSVSALSHFFEGVGMKIIDVERVDSHGGSLRVFAKKKNATGTPSLAVQELLTLEKLKGLREEKVYLEYELRILENRAKLLSMLTGLKKSGKRVAGYGAPAKGNTLLNFFSIGKELLEYIVDDSPHKQGRHTPGKRIPVVSSKLLIDNPPDYLLILAWNFAPSIIAKNEAFRKKGGKFIIPVPRPRIV